MWQSLVRSWLMRTAQDRLRESAQTAGQSRESPGPSMHRPGAAEPAHVGVVFALGIEAGGLVDLMSGVVRIEGAGFLAHEGAVARRRVVVVESGIGQAAAAKATEALILGHRPGWVIAAGFAGGLVPQLAVGDIVLADRVSNGANEIVIERLVRDSSEARPPRLHVGKLLTVDRIVRTANDKRALGERHGAIAVDMESWAVAEVCQREKVRFLAVRAVSDTVDRELPADVDYLVRRTTTAARIGATAGTLLRRPSVIKDLWQLKEDALVASERLGKFLVGVIEQLA